MAEKEEDGLNAEAVKAAQEEVRIIKKAFKDNDPLLKAMRALFMDLDATAAQKSLVVSAFADPVLLALVHRRFLPRLSANAPIGNITDVWLGAEKMVFAVSRDTIDQAIGYKRRAIEMTKKALALLEKPNGTVGLIDEPLDIKSDPLGIEILARNQYINSCEQQLGFFRLIANQEEETPVEKNKRLAKNSAK